MEDQSDLTGLIRLCRPRLSSVKAQKPQTGMEDHSETSTTKTRSEPSLGPPPSEIRVQIDSVSETNLNQFWSHDCLGL